MQTQLENRTVLITGANSGIGAATARAFAAEGARVAIHYLDSTPEQESGEGYTPLHYILGRDAAEALVQQLTSQGATAMALEGDLALPEIIPTLFDRVEATLGPVEILVNNAAHCEEPDTLLQTTPGSLDRTFAVNMRATVLMTAEYARRFQQRQGVRGRVLNLSTDAAQCFPGQIVYGASKATSEAFTRSLAHELGPLGITVNTVAPGPVQTGYITPELEADLLPDIPLGRVGQPEDIADALVFLASEAARWITGQVLKVSGGHCL